MASGRAGNRACLARTAQGLVHDGADRTGTAAALRAAAEATIDLDGFPRARIDRDSVADLGVGNHITGANDHSRNPQWQIRTALTYCSATFFSDTPDRCRQLESYFGGAAGCELLAREDPVHRKQDFHQRSRVHIALHGEGRPVRLGQRLGERQP